MRGKMALWPHSLICVNLKSSGRWRSGCQLTQSAVPLVKCSLCASGIEQMFVAQYGVTACLLRAA
jgi:hypothetical protein